MSDQRQHRKDEEPAQQKPTPADAQKPMTSEPGSPKPKFVFKIVPADPKNSINFEDTADK